MNPDKDIAVTIAANAINKARTKSRAPVDPSDPAMSRKVIENEKEMKRKYGAGEILFLGVSSVLAVIVLVHLVIQIWQKAEKIKADRRGNEIFIATYCKSPSPQEQGSCLERYSNVVCNFADSQKKSECIVRLQTLASRPAEHAAIK